MKHLNCKSSRRALNVNGSNSFEAWPNFQVEQCHGPGGACQLLIFDCSIPRHPCIPLSRNNAARFLFTSSCTANTDVELDSSSRWTFDAKTYLWQTKKLYIYITDEAPCEDSLKHYQNAKYKQMLLRHPKLPDKDHCRRSSTVWFLKTKMLYISKDSSSRLLKIGDSVRTIFQYSTNLLILTRTFYIVNKKFKWIRLLDIFLVRQRIITRHIRGRRAILLS